jgi:hypothetical protein
MVTGQTAKVWPVFIFINMPSTFIVWAYSATSPNMFLYNVFQNIALISSPTLTVIWRYAATSAPTGAPACVAAMRVARAYQRGARTTAPTTSKSGICAG